MVDPMTQTVIPQLRVTRMAASLPFYRDGLGFAVDWSHQFEPDFPWFLQVTRAGQTIFLTEHAGDCQVGGAVYFKVADVDACAREFRSRGVAVVAPADTPWGTREMSLVDPDGNRLRFATHPAE
jgi:catechol 2,3-dioxygenase-like lactoylglutathione lyase family enzyme